MSRPTVFGSFLAKVDYIQPEYDNLEPEFDWVNSDYRRAKFEDIDTCEAISREAREITFRYLNMNRGACSDEVLAEMDLRGLRPATYEELLAFAANYPDEQNNFSIIALGSFWIEMDDRRCAAYLYTLNGERALSTAWYNSVWSSSCRFLAVPAEE